MNSNSIVGFIGGTKRNQIPVLTTAATTATVFSTVTDTGTAPAVLSIPLATSVNGSSNGLGVNVNPAILVPTGGLLGATSEFNSASFDGRPFKVRISGTFSSGVAANGLTLGLYLGSSATVGSNLALGSIVTTGVGVLAGHFTAEAILLWDSVSGQVDGSFNGFIAATGVAPLPAAAVYPTYVTARAAAAAANLQFVAAATFLVSNAANSVQVTDFAIDVV